MSQVPVLSTRPANQSAGPARILVVDDEQYVCDICSRKLREAGYEVVATNNAQDALQALLGSRLFDLMLADIRMPHMSGLDLARIAREVDPAVAIIMMTGDASSEHLRQAARRDITDFLVKPFELEELRLAVDQALHKRQLLRDNLRLRAVEQLLLSSEAINASLDRNHLSRVILQNALHTLSCTVGFLSLTDEHGRLGDLLASSPGWNLSEAGRQAMLTVYQSRQPLTLRDQGPLCHSGEQNAHFGIVMPLRAHGEIAGLMLLADQQAGFLRAGSEEIAALIANQAGIALRNAYHYGKLQEAYQQLQELDRLKSEFIAIASHELRTPLSIVLGYAMMLRDQSDGQRRDFAQRILDSGHHIKDLVDDMVNLRNLELHRVELSLDRCELHELVSQAVERMQQAAQQKDLTLTARLPEQPLVFVADRDKLLLVLGNLISNAIKFTPRFGTIDVNAAVWPASRVFEASRDAMVMPASATMPDPASTRPMLVVEVRDTGIGIPQREQPRIFERFYQIADSLTRDHGGTGLGLAIVRDLIELQEGIIWVQSEEGSGSTFTFALPLRPFEESRSVSELE